MKESDIEKKVSQYAKSTGWLSYKFSSPNSSGVPDRIFLKNGKCAFVEFKQSGKVMSALQAVIAKRILAQKFQVYTVDSVENGVQLFDNLNSEKSKC